MNVLTLINTIIFDNVGICLTNFVILITVLGSLLFMAYNFRLGLMLLFLMQSVEFILFYSLGLELTIITITLLSNFVLLALSLILSYNEGGGIR